MALRRSGVRFPSAPPSKPYITRVSAFLLRDRSFERHALPQKSLFSNVFRYFKRPDYHSNPSFQAQSEI